MISFVPFEARKIDANKQPLMASFEHYDNSGIFRVLPSRIVFHIYKISLSYFSQTKALF